ncbi:hypothetical protein MLC52_05195 [Sulfurimonas sp. NW15]|uniref:hypothetical protein n=1 Tax=Sulfurimonas sp. NW15 TaxID=2922729 RepID=UPI003DA98E29
MNSNNKYPTTEYAKSLLYKYIPQNKSDKHGLFLFPLQTGSGKTHATIQYMKESLEKESNTTVIYTVNTKHNLQDSYNKLVKILNDEDKPKVIMLKNNFESIVDAFIEHPQKIKDFRILPNFKEFNSLQDSIELIKKSPDLKKEKSIRDAVESNNRALKKEIYRYYKFDEIEDKEQFLYEVGLLYPTIKLHEYKAIFMTTHKLYYPMFGLDGNYTLYTHKHFKNCVLFFDEFDAQKKILLETIIQNKVKSSYEFLDLFKSIVSTFKTKQFHKKYKIDETVYQEVKQMSEDIYDKYSIRYGFKYKFENEMQNESILMDSTLSNVVYGKDNATKIDTKKNQSTHINIIAKEGDLSFANLLRDVSRFLRRFIGMMRSAVKVEVSFIYQQQKDNNIPLYEKKTNVEIIQRVVNDIIKEFGYTIEDRHYKYLQDVIVNGLYETQKGFKSSRDELYEDGFKIVNISQMDRDSKTNNFEFFELNDSPENFMKNLCNHLFVVGISATATINTLMRNFDLSYLASKVNFIIPSKEELDAMDALYIEAKNQKNRQIEIKHTHIRENTVEIVKEYFGDKDSSRNEIELMLKDSDKFQFLRLMRIVDAYREFLLHDEIESFLCLLPAFLRQKELIFSPENLAKWIYIMMEQNYEIFNSKIQQWIDQLKLLKRELHSDFISRLVHEHRLFYMYNSDSDNKEKYQEMFNREIEKKSKVFIISTYQTIGIGANLEYERDGIKKDYDAIYLDKPTAFTQRGFEDDKNRTTKEKQVRAIFEVESLFYRGYFPVSEYRRYLKNILNKMPSMMSYLKLNDSHNSIMTTIIQAIGRLYRTDKDSSKMFIYLDGNILHSVKNFDTTNQTLLPAVKKLIDYTNNLEIEMNDEESRGVQESINRFQERNIRTRQKINYMLHVFYGNEKNVDSHTVQQWEETRKYLLQNPTVNTDAIEFDFCYSKMPKKYRDNKYYYYEQKDDYGEIKIFFEDSFKKTKVSPESVMLDIIANTQELQECVKQNNICLEFKYDHLMTPIAFNNLYKGALGEVIGKYLVEKECGVDLHSFNVNNGDEYERFDYKLEDDSCYFDFKYYSQQTIETFTQKELRDKAAAKLASLDANKALIINIFAEIPAGKSKKPFVDKNIMIVPFLIDITNKNTPIVDKQMMQYIKDFIK